MENKKFTYFDSSNKQVTIDIASDDFKLVQTGKIITDVKMKSKPTTFFKDALRRFRKNKSSVVGAIILGILLLLSLILPATLPQDILVTRDGHEAKLLPKVFEAGTGWWDGCQQYNNISIGIDWDKFDETGEIDGLPTGFAEKDVVGGKKGIKYSEMEYIDAVNVNASGGSLRLNSPTNSGLIPLYTYFRTDGVDNVPFDFSMENDPDESKHHDYKVEVTATDVRTLPKWNYGEQGKYSLCLEWFKNGKATEEPQSVTLIEMTDKYGVTTINLKDKLTEIKALQDDLKLTSFMMPHFTFRLDSDLGPEYQGKIANFLLAKFHVTSNMESEKQNLDGISLLDANWSISIPAHPSSGTGWNKYFWTIGTSKGQFNIYQTRMFRASYRIDVYEYQLGSYFSKSISIQAMKAWKEKGYIKADFTDIDNIKSFPKDQRPAVVQKFVDGFEILNKERCPLVIDAEHPFTGKTISAGTIVSVTFSGTMIRWKELYPDATSCPKYVMGTDDRGRDLLKLTFYGLRTSLLLGIITATVTFLFGLVWGAIAGYFGGWTDILMERFTDILGGIPWIVIMTLAIALYNDKFNPEGTKSTFPIFVLALCLTGWIGTSGITRTQFYRYKDREYILAARTLGASDWRLIFRHILPNAIGTIITSSVLMIPSVIFSEATISYLNLGLQGENSLGLVLSANQQYIGNYPFLILFPSAIMALIMISFNLFGNGLRDAFNPSLKGGE